MDENTQPVLVTNEEIDKLPDEIAMRLALAKLSIRLQRQIARVEAASRN